HLEGDPAVDPARRVVDRTQDIARPPDVVGGDGAGGLLESHLPDLQIRDLAPVERAGTQRVREDGRVGGHPDHVPVADQVGQVPGGQPLPADVVQPHRYAGGGQLLKDVL